MRQRGMILGLNLYPRVEPLADIGRSVGAAITINLNSVSLAIYVLFQIENYAPARDDFGVPSLTIG
ncbi:hypothetical protein Aconfl_35390 [Algoriphagus confluentis]|uniref:Uncharacterized protein n=1 Tax=Algoriphagus confluentis TaxID=1697556 RepID=A0ABQ6PSJ1_9BACT|nr:hypothetical protein Aconfl_35390 [Algoriphagus confluentis]